MAASMPLFTRFKVGASQLEHRIILAPLTRFRADENLVPTAMMVEYYSQRACVPGTLLITEATYISKRSSGYPNAPGLFTEEQLAGWRAVTQAVHAKGSKIWVQLWALGRTANPQVLEGSCLKDAFASSSPVPLDDQGPTPRELTVEEIGAFVQDFAQAASDAINKAGFDGVEIHGASGYLIDQFTQDTCNKRCDEYGGSIENRARFALEVARAVSQAVGPERTGIRLSPWNTFQGMRMQDTIPQFTCLIKGLRKLDLAYLHLIDTRPDENFNTDSDSLDFAVDAWGREKPVLINGGLKPDSAVKVVEEVYKGFNVGTVFGRHFLSNPDLVYRIKKGIELNPYDRNTFYTAGAVEGYTTYPFSKEFLEEFGSQ